MKTYQELESNTVEIYRGFRIRESRYFDFYVEQINGFGFSDQEAARCAIDRYLAA